MMSAVDARPRRLPPAPAEGWLTVGSVAIVVLALAWSIDDPGWIRGQGRLTDFLAPIGLLGMATGLLGAKLGWGRWRTHLTGATFAGLLLPLIAGDLLLAGAPPDLGPAGLAARLQAAGSSAVDAWTDLFLLDRPFTGEWGHYVIALGAIVWASGQYAAYAVFGHRRPLDAVIGPGLVLLANMALTSREQLHLLVMASLGGLLLLTRAHAFDERATWLRRRIGDPSAVTSLYLRGGSAFIAAAVVGSLVLTTTASSAPLQGLWADLPARLVDMSQWLQKYLPLGGASIGGGVVGFGPTAAIAGSWTSDRGVAFTVDVPIDEARAFYWRAAVYADFELTGWSWGATEERERAALDEVLRGSPDDPAELAARRAVRIDISPEGYRGRLVLSPQSLHVVSRDTVVQLTKGGRFFAGVESGGGGGTYTIEALVPLIGDEGGGLTENRLRAAGTDYPAGVRALYLKVPEGAIGPDATALIEEIRRLAATDNPYDLMKVTLTMLRDSGRFSYDTNVTDLPCDGLSTVECFARYRAGYCQYYASTMAVLLRAMGIPTRLVQGFLPGERDAAGHEVVLNAQAHAWVEVYFPGIGWVERDPTGGGLAQDPVLPSGRPVPVTPKPSFVTVTDRPGEGDGDPTRAPGSTGGTTTPRGPGPFIAIGLLLIISIMALGVVAWQRGPRRPMEPDVAWRGVLGLARRFGFGPRPAQTVFEYAGTLGDEVPQVRPELQTVARAKVEVAYGRHVLPDSRLRAIADASRRLRLGLLRLAFRRRRRPRGPRPL